MFVGRRFFSGQKKGGRRRLSHSCPGRSGKSLFSNGGCDAGGREGRKEREKGILKVWPLLWGRSHRYRSGAAALGDLFANVNDHAPTTMERAFEKEISVRAISKMCDYSLTWSVTPDFYGEVLVASPHSTMRFSKKWLRVKIRKGYSFFSIVCTTY